MEAALNIEARGQLQCLGKLVSWTDNLSLLTPNSFSANRMFGTEIKIDQNEQRVFISMLNNTLYLTNCNVSYSFSYKRHSNQRSLLLV